MDKINLTRLEIIISNLVRDYNMEDRKLNKLRKMLNDLKSVVVAYSGGLDSTFLLKVAVDTLGKDNVLAVTARSETYPHSEYREATRLARAIGARLVTIHTRELDIKNFKNNPVNRCYYCKRELFKSLDEIREKHKFNAVVDGTNFDDLKDIRYGRKAAKELGVHSPLLDAKIGKGFIRKYSKVMRLPTWQKPSFACLASRIPFNEKITPEKLSKVERAEEILKGLGFNQVRVRLHGDIARLEFYKDDFRKILDEAVRSKIVKRFKAIGITYISLDLEGYRTGSMHAGENLKKCRK